MINICPLSSSKRPYVPLKNNNTTPSEKILCALLTTSFGHMPLGHHRATIN